MKLSKTSKVTYEISLKTSLKDDSSLEILKLMFMRAGVPPPDLVESTHMGNHCVLYYTRSQARASKVVSNLQKIPIKKVTVHLQKLVDKEWRDRWKKEIRPFKLTAKLMVVPRWHRESITRKKETTIYLDTTIAFGTGLHETTRFMSQFIERLTGQMHSFLDVGTGTGILSIVACKCKVQEVTALDVNKSSILTAKQNLRSNGYNHVVYCAQDFKNYRSQKRYDFVAANLVSQDLMAFNRKLIKFVKPNKYLAISGISLEKLAKVRHYYKDLPLRCLKITKGTRWAAILYRRI